MDKFNKIWIKIALLVNGLGVIVLEIVGTRIVAPYFGSTLYVWTAMIVVTMLALALGYRYGGRLADKHPELKKFYWLFSIAGGFYLLLILLDTFILDWLVSLGIMWGPLVAALVLFFLPLGTLGMITPFAVRLSTKEVEKVGTRVGNLYAISTTGSIIGALLTAYLFIPYLSINIILLITAFVLLIVTIVWLALERSSKNGHKVSILLAIIILFSLFFNYNPATAYIDSAQSFYGEIQVQRIGNITCLVVNNIPQSCYSYNLDGSAYPYVNLMVRGLEQVDNPQKVLVIGDGGGLISREILKTYPEVEIDAVDIDQRIFDLAEQYLFFADQDNVNKIVADGRNYLRESDGGYDAIMIDAFTDSAPVLHLYTKEMFELAKDKMTEQGVLVLNTFGFNIGDGSDMPKSIYNTLKMVYNDAYTAINGVLKMDEREYSNYVHFASQQELERLGAVFPIENYENFRIITDNYNPMEILSLPASGELIKLYVVEKDL